MYIARPTSRTWIQFHWIFFTASVSWPYTSLSTFSFFPRSSSSSPHTGVRNGTNIETRCWYAAYTSGYLDFEMLSVRAVEEKNSEQITMLGKSGQSGVMLSSGSFGR